MKSKILLFLFCAGLFLGCNSDDNTSTPAAIEVWHMANISGGIIGVNEDYTSGAIIWTLNPNNQQLSVDNTNTQNYYVFATGTYSYSLSDINGKTYISINNSEMGSYTVTQNHLIINQNETSGGNGADGFVLTFTKP